MKTILKLLGAIAALVVLVLIAGSVYVARFDPNEEKGRIIQAFRDQTGRELTLGGNISLTLYPWLGITLDDLEIGNREGFSAEHFLAARHVSLRLKTLPLLGSRFEIDTVAVHGLSINLEVDAAGRSNWEDLRAGSDTTGPGSGSGGGGSMNLDSLILGGVDVSDFSLSFTDGVSNQRYAITELNFRTGELVYGEPFDLNLALKASATSPALEAEANLTGTLLYDLDNERYQISPLRLDATLTGPRVPNRSASIELVTGLNADLASDTLTVETLELTAPDAQLQASLQVNAFNSADPQIRTTLNLRGADLAQLFRIADVEPLASQIAQLANRSFSLQTTALVRTGSGDLQVETLEATLLGSTVTGNLTVAGMQTDTPQLQGSLRATGPDLPSVVEVAGQLSGGRDSQLAQAGRELRQVTYKDFLVQTEFDANLQTGTLEVTSLEIDLLGATVNGSLAGTRINSESPAVNGSLQVEGEDLPLLLQIAGWFQDGVESPVFKFGEQLNGSSNKRFAVNMQFDADLQSGNIQVPALNANGLGLALEGNLAAQDMSSTRGSITGQLRLTGNSLREVLAAAGQPELGEVAQQVELQVGVSGNRTALRLQPLQLAATLSGNRIPNSPVQLAARVDTLMNLDRETLTAENFTVNGLGLDASGNLAVRNLLSAPEYDGRLEVAPFNLRQLLLQLNQPAPATADSTVLQNVGLTVGFAGAPNQFALQELALDLDDTSVRGNLQLRDLAAPDFSFDLSINELDLDRYLAPASQSATASTPASDSAPLPVDALRSVNLNGRLAIGRLQVSGLTLEDVSVSASLADGDLTLAPLRTNLYQGSLDGNLRLNAAGELPAASVNIDLQQVALGPLMTDLMGSAQISGRGQVQLTLDSSGNSVAELKRGLNGSGRIALEDGILSGVDVAGVLRQLETILRSRQLAEVSRGQQTAFESFAATLAVNNGVVSSNDLLIRSPGIQLTGRGVLVDLNNDSIAYDLMTTVDRSTATQDTQQFDIGGYTVPIACSGTLAAPRCLPDTGEILRTALAREAQRRVGDLLQRAIGTDTPSPQPEPATPDGATAAPTPTPTDPVTAEDAANRLLNRALDRLRDN